MDDLQERFTTAAQQALKLPHKPDNETLLKLYAFYKQAILGDVTGKRPSFTDLTGRAKYDAWTKVKGVTKDKAMQVYIDLVEKIK